MRKEKKPRYSSMLVIKTNPQTMNEVKNLYYLFSQMMTGRRAERVVQVFGKAVLSLFWQFHLVPLMAQKGHIAQSLTL